MLLYGAGPQGANREWVLGSASAFSGWFVLWLVLCCDMAVSSSPLHILWSTFASHAYCVGQLHVRPYGAQPHNSVAYALLQNRINCALICCERLRLFDSGVVAAVVVATNWRHYFIKIYYS